MMKHVLGVASLLAVTALSSAHAEQGITDTTVTFAQVAAFDGPAAALGTGMRQGIEAAFEEANRNGGVNGRMIALDTYDDGYEPDRSMNMVREVIERDAHIGLIGPVGTPTSQATQPLATAANLPFIGPFTGAGFLRDPELKNVVNIRATYGAETAVWIDHLVKDLGLERIAILYQDDGFGRVGLDGVTAAMKSHGMELVARGSYTRNTVAVKTALLAIRKAEPQAVVMVGAYKPIAEFIRLARKMNMAPVFVNISFVGSDALAAELGAEGEGVIISQVVPFPWDDSIPLVAAYHAALTAADPGAKPGFVSLEGYITGRVAIAALEAAGAALTRDTYLAALQGLGTLNLGGFTLNYGVNDNQGSDVVFLTKILADSSFTPVPFGNGG